MKKSIILVSVLLISFVISKAEKPDFLLVGVTKCGTTSFFEYLSNHPKILRPEKKELNFFDFKFEKPDYNLDWYEKQFPAKEPGKLIGEGTPGYFWKEECLERIAAYCPNAKIIVIFRDPVKRIISDYSRRKRAGHEKLGFEEAIKKVPGKWDYRGYIQAGLYIEHIERWLKFFPREQILFLITEDLNKNPAEEVNKAFKFLGLEEYTLSSYEHYNVASTKEDINPATIEDLKRFYAPYNKRLEEFLGRKLPWG